MARTKVSVTVDDALLDACARLAPKSSRSEVVQAALTRWVRDRRRRALEDDVERYYAALTKEERAEEQRWASASARALGETWK